ncbi:LOW QUALITY PROTEIN: axin interactor, dorsalization-associated protein, partial [Microcebus murinus]|uniref:LOW QUALITY PROTEIN: axin interactor, dorsalization-associated protein n=1 Tax=Microcebus murinus TaxID=30608 RepID=UPI003F6CCAEB
MTLLTIRIEKIDLKDGRQCIDLYITICVKVLNDIDLTPVQDTPVASRKEDITYILFNVNIELQEYVEKLTKDADVFSEFKHHKPKKRYNEMEIDEVTPGPVLRELYTRLTDFKRKKLKRKKE